MVRYREQWLGLLPSGAIVVEAGPSELGVDHELLGDEKDAAARFGSQRRRHFATGRACARLAMQSLGAPVEAVPIGQGRAPLWPPGVVGSISHTEDYCVAALCRSEAARAVGIDAERTGRMSDAVAERVATPAELESDVAHWDSVVFSAKEAFYKMQYPLSETFLGFRDVCVHSTGDSALVVELLRDVGSWAAGDRFFGRYFVSEGHVLTALFLEIE